MSCKPNVISPNRIHNVYRTFEYSFHWEVLKCQTQMMHTHFRFGVHCIPARISNSRSFYVLKGDGECNSKWLATVYDHLAVNIIAKFSRDCIYSAESAPIFTKLNIFDGKFMHCTHLWIWRQQNGKSVWTNNQVISVVKYDHNC